MDQQVTQQIDQQLRQNWATICPQILERFTTASKADLDAARGVDDLVRRIADKTHYSERLVEGEIADLVFSGAGGSSQSRSTDSGSSQSPPPFGQARVSSGNGPQQNR